MTTKKPKDEKHPDPKPTVSLKPRTHVPPVEQPEHAHSVPACVTHGETCAVCGNAKLEAVCVVCGS